MARITEQSKIWETIKDDKNKIDELKNDCSNADITNEIFTSKWNFSPSFAYQQLKKMDIDVKLINKAKITANQPLDNEDGTCIYLKPKKYKNGANNKAIKFTVTDATFELITNCFPNLDRYKKQQVYEYLLNQTFQKVRDDIENCKFKIKTEKIEIEEQDIKF